MIYTDKKRKIDLLEWFLENNFFNRRIEYYMLKFDLLCKIKDIDEKRKKFLEFQIEILNEYEEFNKLEQKNC